MISTIIVLYLSVLTETKNNIDVNFFAISKYTSFEECRSHKSFLDKKNIKNKYSDVNKQAKIYFCSAVPKGKDLKSKKEIQEYVSEIPYCSKYKKNKYFCGHPI
jgi:hypothetical protein